MIILFTIIGILIFIAGCYFGGNLMLNTFHEDIREQIMSSLYGILLWFGLAIIGVIIYGIYEGAEYVVKNLL